MDFTRLGPEAGSRCLVVGGCGGIGLAYVRGLLAGDARVAVLDMPSSLSIDALPPEVWALPVDVTDHATLRRTISLVGDSWNGIDTLAFIAGVNIALTPVAETPLDSFRAVMDVNLTAAFLTPQVAMPYLKRAEAASIVFVSSSLHANAEAGFGAYATSKGGLVSLMKVLAREGAPHIRANAVAPGLVETALLSGGTGRGGRTGASGDFLHRQGAQGERIRQSIPLGRIASPEEVAAPMLFLSGPASSYMTGQTLYVNGGRFTP